MKKLVIVDEYFAGIVGHYYAYNKSVQEIFADNGIPSVIYANKKLPASIHAELNVVPFFDGLPKNNLNKLPVAGPLINRSWFWWSLYKSIKQLYTIESDPDTVFFFTTVVWYNLLPVALAASTSNRKNILLYRLSFTEHTGLSTKLDKVGDWLYKYTFDKLRLNKNIRYCTDSDVIATECGELYGLPMKVMPIPHINDDHPDADTNTAHAGDVFTLYAPGAIREEKGIEFITCAFEYMASVNHPLLRKVVLVTQYNDKGDPELDRNIKSRLERLPMKNIFLGSLSADDYNARINGADIILLPYSLAHGYRARTSGIMSETIAACKPFLTTRGSWMSIQSDKYKTGVTVAYDDVSEFASVLSDIIANYEQYKQKALNAKAGWLAYHSKPNFFKLISELVSGVY